jgi:ribonuclease R
MSRWSPSTAKTRATLTTRFTANRPPRAGQVAVKGWRLLVAIADVSHYVETGSSIDIDAYDRATSVYFPRRVIPMLPEKLSNGLCSLNPEVERLCMVCDMFVAATARSRLPVLSGRDVEPCALHLHRGGSHPGQHQGARRRSRKERVPGPAQPARRLPRLLASRNKRGAVDFETTETQIVCDESGRIEKIVPRTRNDAHKLIEEAMLAANVCSADFILQSKHPGLYRVHEGPTPEKKEILRSYLKATGVGLSISDDPTPGSSRPLPNATKERPDASRSIRCCCVRCSRPSTRRSTAAISAWRSRPTPTSPARSGVTRTCWCTA